MNELRFEKNEEMPVHVWKSILKEDPLRGRFSAVRDFEGEVFVDVLWGDGETEKDVRITVCPYENTDNCPWRWGPTITGDLWCRAVRQTASLWGREISEAHKPRCKAHVAYKDRDRG